MNVIPFIAERHEFVYLITRELSRPSFILPNIDIAKSFQRTCDFVKTLLRI